MASERQNEANRQNAQKSTGPSTPEGRAAVSLNGLKYGLYAQTLILPGEDPAEFDALLDRFHAEYQPSTPTEEAFVSQIVMATWRRARIQRMEVAFYKNQHKECIGHDDWYLDLDDNGRLAQIASRDAVATKLLDSFSRQEARHERSIKSAVHELRRCRAGRRAPDDHAQNDPAIDNPCNDNPDNKDAPVDRSKLDRSKNAERSKNPSTAQIGFGFQVDIAQPDSPLNPAPEPPPPTDQ